MCGRTELPRAARDGCRCPDFSRRGFGGYPCAAGAAAAASRPGAAPVPPQPEAVSTTREEGLGANHGCTLLPLSTPRGVGCRHPPRPPPHPRPCLGAKEAAGEAGLWGSDGGGNGWEAAPQCVERGSCAGTGRRDGKGQPRAGTGRGDEVLGRWGTIGPVEATGFWETPSSPLGEAGGTAPGVPHMVLRNGQRTEPI